MTDAPDAGPRIGRPSGPGLGTLPAAPGSLTAPPGPSAAHAWSTDAQRWLATAGGVVARLDADAAAATHSDTYSADVMLAVTLTFGKDR